MNGHQRQREESRRMIEQALFSLMEEKDFARITVSEIAKRADVGRRTFYRLYRDKEQVLHGYFEKMCGEYRSAYPKLKKYDVRQIAGDFFEFWNGYRDFLLLMHRSGLDAMLYYELSRAAGEIIENRIAEEGGWEPDELGYFADYTAGGFLFLLYRWIDSGMKEPPGEYAEKTGKAVLKFLREI